MTLRSMIFGTEVSAAQAVRSLILLTVTRWVWFMLNTYPDPYGMSWVLLPWPIPFWTWQVWAIDLLLMLLQARSTLQIGRALLISRAPSLAASIGLGSSPVAATRPEPRTQSWLPTAALFCLVITLTCTMGWWIILMLYSQTWFPLDPYVAGNYGNAAFWVGITLSALGFLFGGRYIARASGQVGNMFNVTTVDDDHWLAQRVHRYAEQLGLPKPAVGITKVTNAFAVGANQKTAMIVIGTPLFSFEKDELDAIIGHELGHVLYNDVARMQFAEGFQRMLVSVVNGLTLIGVAVAQADNKSRTRQMNVLLAQQSGRLVRGTVFVSSELVAKGISRKREFHADAVGAFLTSPDAMGRALKRVHGVSDAPTPEERHYGYLMFRGSRFGKLFATHPTLEARLRALNVEVPGALKAVTPDPISKHPLAPTIPLEAPTGAPAFQAVTNAVQSVPIAKTLSGSLERLSWRKMAAGAAAIVALVMLLPAVISYYRINDYVEDTGTAVTSMASYSWGWLSDRGSSISEAAFGSRTDSNEALELVRLQVENQQLRTSRDASLNETSAALIKISQLTGRVSSLQDELTRTRSSMTRTDPSLNNDAVEDQQKQAAALRLEVSRMQEEMQEKDRQIEALNAENFPQRLESLQNEIARLSARRDTRESVDTDELATLRKQEGQLRQEIARLQQDLSLKENRLQGFEVENYPQRMASLQATNTLLLKAVDAERTQRRVLEERIATLKQEAGQTSSPGQSASVSPMPLDASLKASTSPPVYGAFATSNTGLLILTDIDFRSADDARQGAMMQCQQFGGGPSCQVHATINNVCAAIARVTPATKNTAFQVRSGASQAEAEQRALDSCVQKTGRACILTRSLCPS